MKENDIVTSDPSGRKSKGRRNSDVVTLNCADLEKQSCDAATIRSRIDAITNLPGQHAGDHSVALSIVLANLSMRTISVAEYGEFTDEAIVAQKTAMSALSTLREAARKKEQEDEARRAKEAARMVLGEEGQRQDAQRRAAMDAIKSIQSLSGAGGSAQELLVVIDAIAARPITEEEFGLAAQTVKMAQDLALQALRLKYEQALIEEMGQQMHQDIQDVLAATHEVVMSAPAQFTGLPFASQEPTARELAIAEAVREACYETARAFCTDVRMRWNFEGIELTDIIASVKEGK